MKYRHVELALLATKNLSISARQFSNPAETCTKKMPFFDQLSKWGLSLFAAWMNPWVGSLGIQVTPFVSHFSRDFEAITTTKRVRMGRYCWRIYTNSRDHPSVLLSLGYLHLRPPDYQGAPDDHRITLVYSARVCCVIPLAQARRLEGKYILQMRTCWCVFLPRWVHSLHFIPQQSNFEVREICVDDLRDLYFVSLPFGHWLHLVTQHHRES